MSGPDDSGGGGVGGDVGMDENEDEIDGPTKRNYPKEESKPTCAGKIVSFFKLKDAKKKLVLPERWRGRKKRRRRRKMGGGSCLCLKKPLTLDSSGESPTSDPNSPAFTYGMLRSFIEKNDFYDKDCNPHSDDE